MKNYAKNILVPDTGVFRTIFLYVGQGESTLMVLPDGNEFKYVLIDTNNDIKNGGIDISKMLTDLLDDGLDVFINTHPHNDHLNGIKEIHDSVGIKEIWHSGHKPGLNHNDTFKKMQSIIDDIGSENEFILFGTNDINKVRETDKETEIIKPLGDVEYIIVSPAEYVADDIENEKPEERYKRIHEQCAVLKFSYGIDTPRHILITGDADKTAWEEYITEYHKEKLPAHILSAAHHGSRSFFMENEDDDNVYEKHIEEICPSHIIVSAPKQSESYHGHPHDDAIELYNKYVDKDSLYHLGNNRECVIIDIDNEGDIEIKLDQDLVKDYGHKPDNNGTDNGGTNESVFIASQTTRLDEKQMGKK